MTADPAESNGPAICPQAVREFLVKSADYMLGTWLQVARIKLDPPRSLLLTRTAWILTLLQRMFTFTHFSMRLYVPAGTSVLKVSAGEENLENFREIFRKFKKLGNI